MYDANQVAAKLGSEIARRRKTLGITQEHLAELSGVSVRFLSSLERGKPTARLGAVLAVLDALGLEPTLRIRGQR